jgi:hypothetical protein
MKLHEKSLLITAVFNTFVVGVIFKVSYCVVSRGFATFVRNHIK